MRKGLAIVVIAMVAVGLLALVVGCGGKKTVKTDEGETTYTTGITEEDLGVPLYPGAELDEGAAGTIKTETEEGEEIWAGAILWTNDDISKVIDWYKDKLSGKPEFTDSSMDIEGEKLGMLTFQEGDTVKYVMITEGLEDTKGKVQISITSGAGMDMP